MKFTVCSEFFFVIFVEAYNLSDLGSYVDGIDRSRSGVCEWRKLVSIIDGTKILCLEYHSKET